MKILVLLSTYNGEKYLREQLDSILCQRNVTLKLLIRDDGSIDETRKLLDEYRKKNNNIQCFYENNVGFVSSFSRLVQLGLDDSFDADYYAFADQDDIWFENKLYNACKYIIKESESIPCLCECNSIMIDSQKNELGLFHSQKELVFRKGSALLHGSVQGCAMVFNKAAAIIFNENRPKQAWHDRWLFMICSFFGKIYYNSEPNFYYRIHQNNTLANEGLDIRKHLKKQFSIFFKKPIHLAMAEEFYSTFENRFTESDKEIFKVYFTYRKNFLSKLKLLFSVDFSYPFNNHIILYYTKVLLGRI